MWHEIFSRHESLSLYHTITVLVHKDFLPLLSISIYSEMEIPYTTYAMNSHLRSLSPSHYSHLSSLSPQTTSSVRRHTDWAPIVLLSMYSRSLYGLCIRYGSSLLLMPAHIHYLKEEEKIVPPSLFCCGDEHSCCNDANQWE